ncbi:hypothetical protein K443DRAFT_680960 [Laccaria amethystina LaAM-08-1]|uniref:Uncharacterized protein n=1 Tax=Laccaria amethystina LaAM-08-1 TaxID=1095629 RepID=A0A0C9XKP8_9AGAR|nr:hypothetical protein K443DRAFT_680960 [Laccaria amethystina LaAM-08-1]
MDVDRISSIIYAYTLSVKSELLRPLTKLLNRRYYSENALPTSIWVGRQNFAKKIEAVLPWFLRLQRRKVERRRAQVSKPFRVG